MVTSEATRAQTVADTDILPDHLRDTIVEIGSARDLQDANWRLENGWKLLAIRSESTWQAMPHGHLRSYTVFIMGRPEGVKELTP